MIPARRLVMLGLALTVLAACQRDAELGLSAERNGPQVLNPQAPPPPLQPRFRPFGRSQPAQTISARGDAGADATVMNG